MGDGYYCYLHFVHYIEGIFKPRIRENDFVQGIRDSVRSCLPIEGIHKIGMRVWNARMAAEDNKSSDCNEDKGQHFHDPDAIGKPVRCPSMEDNN